MAPGRLRWGGELLFTKSRLVRWIAECQVVTNINIISHSSPLQAHSRLFTYFNLISGHPVSVWSRIITFHQEKFFWHSITLKTPVINLLEGERGDDMTIDVFKKLLHRNIIIFVWSRSLLNPRWMISLESFPLYFLTWLLASSDFLGDVQGRPGQCDVVIWSLKDCRSVGCCQYVQ